jgi:hypothetical protein
MGDHIFIREAVLMMPHINVSYTQVKRWRIICSVGGLNRSGRRKPAAHQIYGKGSSDSQWSDPKTTDGNAAVLF